MNPHDPIQGNIDYGESKVEINYFTEPDPVIDLIRPEGTEQISLNDLLDLVPQHILIVAWEQAKETRHRQEQDLRFDKEYRYSPDPATSYMNDLLDEMSRSDADPGL